jgi:ABC transporter substrate binding protein
MSGIAQEERPMSDMRRREFITLLSGAAASPFAGSAQQSAGKVARLGFLGGGSASGYARPVEALRAGLRDLGYVEGQNIHIEFAWADGKYERLPDLARNLVHLKVDLIVTHGLPGTSAAKQATETIPIVMAIVGDAVAFRLVTNVARPNDETSRVHLGSRRHCGGVAANGACAAAGHASAWVPQQRIA